MTTDERQDYEQWIQNRCFIYCKPIRTDPRNSLVTLSELNQKFGEKNMQGVEQIDSQGNHVKQSYKLRERIRINVSGEMFETFEDTLARYPTTLLGSHNKRRRYFDPRRCEYYFDRDKTAFNAILFYYQSPGILAKPATVSYDIFAKEMKFFELEKRVKQKDINSSKGCTGFRRTRAIRAKIWQALENPIAPAERIISSFSGLMILFSMAVFCWETLPSVRRNADDRNARLAQIQTALSNNTTTIIEEDINSRFWVVVESMFSGWFTLEYLARLTTAPNTLYFVFSFAALIDLIAILPFYISLIFRPARVSDIVSFPLLRLVRLVRILKLKRHSTSVRLLFETIFDSREELHLFLMCMLFITVLMSSALFYAEGEHHQSQFSSIPDVFWYAVVTLSSVGYGDYVPKTATGKLIGATFCVTGVVVIFCFSPVLFAKFRRCSGRYYSELAELQLYREETDKIYNQNREGIPVEDRTERTSKSSREEKWNLLEKS